MPGDAGPAVAEAPPPVDFLSRPGIAAEAHAASYGVLDVGSNSIRLVVFEALGRAPAVLFNERELCGLGAALSETGALSPGGIDRALVALRRFAAVASALGVGRLDAVATAAVREASDAERFRAQVERETGITLLTLSGEEEARFAALGVLSAFPGASGVMADLGGGSLELVRLSHGRPAEHATLPLGVLRLGRAPLARRTSLAVEHLGTVSWLRKTAGQPFYLVGGAWRALARIGIAERRYPIPIVNNFCLAPGEARDMASAFAEADPTALKSAAPGIRARRLETVPSGATVLRALLADTDPDAVLFSAFGLREGLLYDRLPAAAQAADPLESACREIACRDGRSLAYGEALAAWVERASMAEFGADRRLQRAASLLSEISWRQHPDIRGIDAFTRVSRAPFVGIDHPGRVFVALAVTVRYKSNLPSQAERAAALLLSPHVRGQAVALGLALRLAASLSSGEPAVLEGSRLSVADGRLVLRVAPRFRPLVSGKAAMTANALARTLECNFAVEDA